jgi:F-type H+-transporting ATPase subunit delta
MLTQNGRLALLAEIATLFDALKDEQEGVVDVTVTAATTLDAKQQETLIAALTRRLKSQVRLHTEVDAKLIGGAVIRAGDLVIDGSLRTQLERMAFELSA